MGGGRLPEVGASPRPPHTRPKLLLKKTGVINSNNFRGGGVFRPLHNPPTNLFVENYIKNGGKGLKNASFLVINSAPPAANLFVGGKKTNSKEGGGE